MTIRVSASQIDNFRRCRRKWALEKIAGVQAPPNRYAEHGLAVHKALEAWARSGTPLPDDDVGATAMPAVRHVPEPGREDVDCETFFDFRLPNVDAVVRGFIDQVHWGDEGQVVVRDYKTTGNLSYAHTAESLARDTQATLYAYAALEHLFSGAEHVDLEWLYLQRVKSTDGRGRAHPVRLRVHASGTDAVHAPALGGTCLDEMPLDEIEDTVREMIAAWEEYGEDAMSAPPDYTACDMFGGCPHVEVCQPSAEDKLRSAMGQVDLLSKLKNKGKEAEQSEGDNVNPPAASGGTDGGPPEESAKAPKSGTSGGSSKKPAAAGPNPDLSLRDHLAMQALAGLAANPARTTASADELAAEAYAYADAAIKARS